MTTIYGTSLKASRTYRDKLEAWLSGWVKNR